MPELNETILINWRDCLFSENIYAYFEFNCDPAFSDKIEDVLLPEDYQHNKVLDGLYEIFEYDENCEEYIYAGRLYVPKNKPLDNERALEIKPEEEE